MKCAHLGSKLIIGKQRHGPIGNVTLEFEADDLRNLRILKQVN